VPPSGALSRSVDAWILDYHLDGGDTGIELRALASRWRPSGHPDQRRPRPGTARAGCESEIHLLYKPIKPLALRSCCRACGG
jgi:hypothetical protein